ncbi:S41 family peptidase [Streptomyces fulvoviolaceus]|uniref:S41 family peptidase n=1 Tax=Streptomyces fulvoviolaceus TaxID=285535 RepID=UPI0009960EA2|nr:S41 family peptidase [Streptomyces fulvoviolaceus]MCT9078059.1 S41 family peptidase [Streptomyces fulvoviolaceus]
MATTDLSDFLLGTKGTLTLADRRTLTEQALVLFEDNYVHLPLKTAMHAVHPVQRLRLLLTKLGRQTEQTMDPEWRFHAELSAIFHSVRDLHTNYLLPAPFSGKIAYLPFRVEEYYDTNGPRYVVTHVVRDFTAPAFGPGVVIDHWNGVPIDREVDLAGDRFAGSNPAARHSRGLQSLTVRPLVMHLPPNEDWVVVGYTGTDGTARELRQPWRVTDNLPPYVNTDDLSAAAVAQGTDLVGDEISRATKMLFVPDVLALEEAGGPAPQELTAEPAEAGQDIPTTLPGFFRARAVQTPSGVFGHIRVFTFNTDDPDGFVEEFVRLLALIPQDGLVLDMRDNGGGHIFASEFLLQTLTPRRIAPEPTQFISSPLNLRLCRRHATNPTRQIDLGPWFRSLDQAVETGASFSATFPITPEDGANALGQQYQGPVVLVTNARCYSATDIFAAGFQDHAVGPVLGVDDNTGAGGANVWTHGLLKALFELPAPADTASPFQALPGGANMRVAIRRTVRVGAPAGTPVEDLGVVPEVRHRMTRDDVLHDNTDLLARAGQVLASLPAYRLDAALDGADGTLGLRTSGLDRVDVFVAGRPRASVDVSDGDTSVTVTPAPGPGDRIRIEGYAAGDLAAARTLISGA